MKENAELCEKNPLLWRALRFISSAVNRGDAPCPPVGL